MDFALSRLGGRPKYFCQPPEASSFGKVTPFEEEQTLGAGKGVMDLPEILELAEGE